MFSRCFLSCFLAFICLLVSVRNSEANIDIVVSIKPVHSLVAAVMNGIAKPHLLIDGFDPHIWLDPINAKVLVHHITEWLVISDSQNAVTYLSNSKLLLSELDSLIEQVGAQLTNVKHENYIVFHDAYQHFEARFDIPAAGAITISPNQPPGANRLREIQRKIHNTASICVFAEPQFEPTMVTSLSELLNVRTGIIDPIGASIDKGPGLYSKLLLNMAGSIKDCLSPTI